MVVFDHAWEPQPPTLCPVVEWRHIDYFEARSYVLREPSFHVYMLPVGHATLLCRQVEPEEYEWPTLKDRGALTLALAHDNETNQWWLAFFAAPSGPVLAMGWVRAVAAAWFGTAHGQQSYAANARADRAGGLEW